MSSESEAILSVMTLNTWGFRWPLARHRTARFRRIAEHLHTHDYDVVALQEMWDRADEVLGETPQSWLRRPEELKQRRGHRMADSGLAVKVSTALTGSAAVRSDLVRGFENHRSWDRMKRKGVFAVELPVPGLGPVTLLNTHLQAGRSHAYTRRTQLEELLETAAATPLPIILCGDFNFHAGSAEDRAAHAALDRAGFVDASQSLDRLDATYLQANPYAGGGVDERFDRIYLRDGVGVSLRAEDVRVVIDHAAPMSDHEALTARVVVSRV